MKNRFTKERTLIAKAIALILLLWHHIAGFYFNNDGIITNIGIVAKVCVCIFLILSGYGISASYDNQSEKNDNIVLFVFSHLEKIMIKFWIIYLLFLPINYIFAHRTVGMVYGTMRWDALLIDFLGLHHLFHTPTMTRSWWYMSAIIVFYLCFPYLRYILKKNKLYYMGLNLIVAIVVGITQHSLIQSTNPILFYLFAFSIGMLCYEIDFFNKIYVLFDKHKYFFLGEILLLIFSIYLRWEIGNEIDTLLGLTIIVFVTYIIPTKGIFERVLSLLGKKSGEIFMMHVFVYGICFNKYVYIYHNIFVVIALTLFYSLLISMFVSQIERRVYIIFKK